MIKGFNTGRKYTANGQRIAYSWDGATVIFADFDRMIYGEYASDVEPTNSSVLAVYDSNGYHMSCAAMQLRSNAVEFVSVQS